MAKIWCASLLIVGLLSFHMRTFAAEISKTDNESIDVQSIEILVKKSNGDISMLCKELLNEKVYGKHGWVLAVLRFLQVNRLSDGHYRENLEHLFSCFCAKLQGLPEQYNEMLVTISDSLSVTRYKWVNSPTIESFYDNERMVKARATRKRRTIQFSSNNEREHISKKDLEILGSAYMEDSSFVKIQDRLIDELEKAAKALDIEALKKLEEIELSTGIPARVPTHMKEFIHYLMKWITYYASEITDHASEITKMKPTYEALEKFEKEKDQLLTGIADAYRQERSDDEIKGIFDALQKSVDEKVPVGMRDFVKILINMYKREGMMTKKMLLLLDRSRESYADLPKKM